MKKHLFSLSVSIFTVAFLLVGCQSESPVQPKASHSSKSAKVAYSLNNWMSLVSSSLTLSQLSIPGTHDSGALYEPVSGTAKCQNLTIGNQLAAGIRFLDVRCRHIDNAFAIHHGAIYQNLNFDDVLNACWSFLASNPTETIIMSVKEEYNSSNVSRTFEQTFDSYIQKNPNQWYLGSSVPALGTVRGKIVLLRRFGATSTPKGIDATNWADNTTFTSGILNVQDYYNVSSADQKWTSITNQFNAALAGSSNTLYLNYTSGYKALIFGIPSITTVSNSVNPKITTYFTTNTSGRYGIIPMDFADSGRSSLIIATNF
ncbi:phosphatidylinositol-specific phospholipase C [Cytophagaceae bacterium DM2B3-1]|uniref:1-phosphatidylinositol phosphodiesterase n=1 Tax=Xanthocytophaga flava TaxID=3048013 RepID=A0ABT7CGC3_9BACT|nr:phosphatidylinositol-specific phospholipase C [Xanthocytophaga flavus]MDJ1492796.1 phosphatidylinositol-specific phospholipase C [Xanthocytophaga flavus]